MPREWHDRHSANRIEGMETRRLYQRIVADKKPYFMRYIYPALMKQYNTYIKNTHKNALREFRMTVDELRAIPEEKRTERQKDFLKYYDRGMPVGVSDCVMNRICRRFEQEFDGYLSRKKPNSEFDYTVMKSGTEYSKTQYDVIVRLYENYNQRLKSYAVFASYERVDEYDTFSMMLDMRNEFMAECTKVCPDRQALCDIVLDVCYRRSSTKRFAWEVCGDEIIRNLLERHGGVISFPEADLEGEIEFAGRRFRMRSVKIGGEA